MKRFLIVFLILSILVSCLGVSVSAESDYFIDLLEFGGINGFSQYYINGSNRIQFFMANVFVYDISYIDVIFSVGSDVTIRSCAAGPNSTTFTSLTVTSLGDGVYRAYGDVDFSGGSIYFRCLVTASTSFNLKSFKIGSHGSAPYKELGSIYVISERAALNTNGWVSQSSSGEVVGPSENVSSSGSYQSYEFTVNAFCSSWMKYDKLTFAFKFDVESITGIIAESDGVILPVEYSYFNLDNNGIYYSTVEEGSGVQSENTTGMWAYGVNSECYVVATIDLSGLKRTASEPQLRIYGTTCISPDGVSENKSGLQLWSVVGSVNSISINATDILLSGLYDYVYRSWNILTSWYSAWTESNTVDDDQQQTYDENKGSLDSVITESDSILAETPTLPVVEVGDNLDINTSCILRRRTAAGAVTNGRRAV